MPRYGLVVAVLAVVALGPRPAEAQTTSASIAGTVVDEQGGVLPGATVTLTRESRGTVETTTTDRLGQFLFAYVAPDVYTLRVALVNFVDALRTSLVVNANDRVSLGRVMLRLGSLAGESITVVAYAPDIQLRGGERAFILESAAVEKFAVNGRSFFALAGMAPGVVANTATPTDVSAFNVNGQRANSNNLTIDGVANIDTGNNGGNMVQTNTDAIAEFKVLTSSYQAEYGRAVGGQVQVVTKSGSRDFRGSAYWYGRRSAWNANTWWNNRDGTPKETSARNDEGYTLGGPVWIPGLFNRDRKKLFFFWNQEFQRHTDPVSETRATVPTLLERRGDFSQSVDASGNSYPYIRDYTTGLPCNRVNTSGCFKDGGVLGRIPAGRLYAPTLAALSLYPEPNVSGRAGYNYRSQAPSSQALDQLLLRADYQAGDNWRATGRYMRNSNRTRLPYGTLGFLSNLDIVDLRLRTPGRNWLGTVTGILDNATALEVSVGSAHNAFEHAFAGERFTRANLQRLANGQALPMLDPGAVRDDYIPFFNYGATLGLVTNAPMLVTAFAPFSNDGTTYDALANLTRVARAHNLKAGVYFQKSLKDQTNMTGFNGQFVFTPDSGSPFDSSHPFANAALGVFTSLTQASAQIEPKWRYANLEWYVQDNWKASDRLTLDLGVRFYYMTPQWDVSRVASNWLPEQFDPSAAVRLYRPAVVNGVRVGYDAVTGATVSSALVGRVVPGSGNRFNGSLRAGQGISDTLTDGARFRVSPRLGFAYDVTGNQRLAARGGFAVLYDRPQGNQVYDLANNPPGIQAQTLNWGLVSQATAGGLSALSLYPNVYSWKVPTVYQWNLSVQARLPASLTLDLAYVGSRSRNLLQYRNLNAVPYGAAYDQANWDPTRGKTCSGCLALGTVPGANALQADFLRPYQGFGDIRLWEFGAYSDYKAVQTTLTRRFRKGLLLNGSYTWSSVRGTGGDDWSYARSDDRDREANYGPLSYDRTHVLRANFVYETPRVNGRILGFLLDLWQFSGSYSWMSGTPATASYFILGVNNVNLTGSATESARIALTGEPIGKGWSSDPYNQFNVSAFTAPQPGSIGLDSPRFTMRNPPTGILNLSVAKSVPFGGRRRLEVRLDAFNAPNAVQVSGVNRTLIFASLASRTPANLAYDSNGKLVNPTGVGTVSGVLPARQLQLMTRFTF